MPKKPKTLGQRTSRKAPDRFYDKRRQDTQAVKLRGSANWQKVREIVLNRNPLCVECEKAGLIEVAKDVDHIIPLASRPDLAFALSNLQGLCRSCHNRKTAQE